MNQFPKRQRTRDNYRSRAGSAAWTTAVKTENRRKSKIARALYGTGFTVDPLERRLLLVGDTTEPIFSQGLSNLTSPAHITLTFSVLPTKVDPNYTGGSPTGTVTIGWWGGPIIATSAASSTPVVIPLTLDATDDGTEIPPGVGNTPTDHVLYITYTDSGNFASSTFTANDFTSTEYEGVPGYPVSFVAGSSNHLAVTSQPSNAAAGAKFDPAVKVAELDASGSVNTTAVSSIKASLASTSTGKGTLGGVTTVATVGGVASFSDLTVSEPGQYSLNFTDSAGDTTASGLFEISGGQLKFQPPPTDGTAGESLKPVVVKLEDSKGKLNTDASSTVTLSILGTGSSNPITGNTAPLVGGIATFSNLQLATPGFYKLDATDDEGDTDIVSNRFKVSGDHLVFRTVPTSADPDTAFAVTVGIFNSKNQLDTSANSMLQLSLNVLSGDPTTQLGGITLAQFTGGLATFTVSSGPRIPSPGKYTLTATEEDDSLGVLAPSNLTTAITSKQIAVSGFHLVFKPQPKNTDTNTALDFSVEVLDSKNKLASSINSGSIALTLLSTPANSAALSTYTNPGFVGGIDEFSDGISPSIDTPGKVYTLRASALDDSGNPDSTIGSVTSAKFQISGLSIKFLKQPPGDIDAGNAIPFTVELVDSHGKINTTESPLVSITASPTTPISVFVNLQFEQGLAVYTADAAGSQNIKIKSIGRYTLTATALETDGSGNKITAIEPGISEPFHVFGYHIVLKQPPDNSTSRPGNGSYFVAALEDIHGKVQTADLGVAGLVSAHSTADGNARAYLSAFNFTDGEISVTTGLGIPLNDPGQYTLTIDGVSSTDDITPSPLVESVTSHVFKVFAPHLLFTTQPEDEPTGNALPQITVQMQSADGDILNAIGDVLQISYVPVGSPAGSAVVLATKTITDATATSFDLLTVNSLGSFKLIATVISSPTDPTTPTEETVTAATSSVFTIRG